MNDQQKELTIKNVVEDLLQKNAALLAENDVQQLKPLARNPRPKPAEVDGTQTSIVQPSDPTKSCTLPPEKTTNINEALVELPVNEGGKRLDQELVCALGSKILLLPPNGQPLQMDITCYWCNFCSYRTEKKDALLKHVMEHRFHCKFCSFQSFSRAKVIQHCKEQHDEFKDTAATLIYCSYLPDYMSGVQSMKRKADEEEKMAKRAKTDAPGMDGDASQQSTSHQPKKATARKSLPAPVPITNSAQSPIKPVIMNVVSGQEAVSAVTGESHPPKPPEPEKKVTVSSGLCWNCGYCGFVTLSQAFLKIHLNAVHHGKAHKYVAMLVSSEEEMNRLKASDAQLVLNPSGDMPQPQNMRNTPSSLLSPVASKSASPAPSKTILPPSQNPTSSEIEIDNAEEDAAKAEKTAKEKEAEAKIPISFKCAHCNFSSPQVEKVKSHLLMRHSGSVIYALDMKAVKLRQQRYVFFCLKKNCKFNTKDMDEFISHTDTCSPWLQGKQTKDVDQLLIKSLELTRQFTTKIGKNKSSENVEVRAVSGAEYGCFFCQYVSNNNTRVKKHVISSHDDRNSIFKDFQADKNKTKPTVYFCRFCLWESREGSELELHLSEKHADKMNERREEEAQKTAVSAGPTATALPPHSASPVPSSVRSPSTASSTPRGSPSPAVSSSESEVLDDTYITYSGLVSKSDLDKAIAEYAECKKATEKKPRGRPARSAALKAEVNVKVFEGKMPTLFLCLYCKGYSFGVNLMKSHLSLKHKRSSLKASDVEKEGRKIPSTVYFCPADTCISTYMDEQELKQHAKQVHNQIVTPSSNTDKRKKDSPKKPQEPDPNKETGEKYECLYCDTSIMFNNRISMKKHLIEKHANEEFVYRDCIARKLRQNSRFYMCHDLSCEYTCEKQKNYSLHLLAHKMAKVYECLQCEWFTSNPDEVAKHVLDLHKGQKVVSMEVELDLDSSGNLVKIVGGKRIKAERQ